MTQASCRDRLEMALFHINEPSGEGRRACLTVYGEAARAAADAADARARDGISLGPLDGRIVSIKDLFDVAGEVTRAGSRVLAEEGTPAQADAPLVTRLRAAGAVIIAKTNMSEFAYTGIGINPHFGTPANPADRTRVPGGSSSGAAVAAADGMCEIAIGTDTGGSVRIPASLCGIVGYKPSRQRVPATGVFPLAYSLDSIGPLARSVADCAMADTAMAADEPWMLEPAPLTGLRIGVAQGMPLEALDEVVSARFGQALDRLEKAGARLSKEKMPVIDDMVRINARSNLLVAEAYHVHRDRLARRAAQRVRIDTCASRGDAPSSFGGVVRRMPLTQQCRQRSAQGFTDRVLIIGAGPACHLENVRGEHRFPVENRERAFQARSLDMALGSHVQQDADNRAPPKGHPHTHPGHEFGGVGRGGREIVETAVERRGYGDAEQRFVHGRIITEATACENHQLSVLHERVSYQATLSPSFD